MNMLNNIFCPKTGKKSLFYIKEQRFYIKYRRLLSHKNSNFGIELIIISEL